MQIILDLSDARRVHHLPNFHGDPLVFLGTSVVGVGGVLSGFLPHPLTVVAILCGPFPEEDRLPAVELDREPWQRAYRRQSRLKSTSTNSAYLIRSDDAPFVVVPMHDFIRVAIESVESDRLRSVARVELLLESTGLCHWQATDRLLTPADWAANVPGFLGSVSRLRVTGSTLARPLG